VSIVLAIETSQRTGSVAARRIHPLSLHGIGPVEVEPLAPKLRHDDDLLPAIDRLMRRLDAPPRDLAAVGVSVGPGGFTGLRIAISTAKMLAEALGARLVAVPSALVAAAAQARRRGGAGGAARPLLVALASKGDTCWLTRIDSTAGGPVAVGAAGLVSAGTLDLAGARELLADEHLPAPIRARCHEAGVPVIPPIFEAAACLEVTEQHLAAGNTIDPLVIAPLYPRPPEAVTLWEQRGR
jgi:tRNA threonylcarbamoyladenosine biosynthesis protein TsaB